MMPLLLLTRPGSGQCRGLGLSLGEKAEIGWAYVHRKRDSMYVSLRSPKTGRWNLDSLQGWGVQPSPMSVLCFDACARLPAQA